MKYASVLGGAVLLLHCLTGATGFVPPACWGRALASARPSRAAARVPGLAMASQSEREAAKKELLVLAAGPGKKDGSSKDAILAAVRKLEQMNPTPKPAESPLLSGTYSLLFTGSESDEELKARKKREGFIGSTLTETSGASDSGGGGKKSGKLIRSKETSQDIDLAGGAVVNRATFSVLGLGLEVCLEGTCARVDEEEFKYTRIDVAFRRVLIKIGRLPALRIPLGWVNTGKGPQGSVTTTYLDEELRLGRGDKGSVFVTVRRKA